jgi:hypothetical protein
MHGCYVGGFHYWSFGQSCARWWAGKSIVVGNSAAKWRFFQTEAVGAERER